MCYGSRATGFPDRLGIDRKKEREELRACLWLEPLESRSWSLLRGRLMGRERVAVFTVLWGSNFGMSNLVCVLVAFSVTPKTAT